MQSSFDIIKHAYDGDLALRPNQAVIKLLGIPTRHVTCSNKADSGVSVQAERVPTRVIAGAAENPGKLSKPKALEALGFSTSAESLAGTSRFDASKPLEPIRCNTAVLWPPVNPAREMESKRRDDKGLPWPEKREKAQKRKSVIHISFLAHFTVQNLATGLRTFFVEGCIGALSVLVAKSSAGPAPRLAGG